MRAGGKSFAGYKVRNKSLYSQNRLEKCPINRGRTINSKYEKINDYLIAELKENESLIGFSKWGKYLPLEYQAEIVKERYYDFENAIDLINNMKLIENE